jgi:hypothetical protein
MFFSPALNILFYSFFGLSILANSYNLVPQGLPAVSNGSENRKVDRNADNLQRTLTNVGEQESALGATGRMATNIHGHIVPYPPSASYTTAHPHSC